jgi:recombination associated protein RdgC
MWFNNICVFRVADGFEISAEALAERLEPYAFKHCLSQEMSSAGWFAPLGQMGGAELVYSANNCILVCLQTEEKVLPAAVVKELLAEKVLLLEASEQRTLRRAEKERLRDELMLELLPRAFVRHRLSYGYFDWSKRWLVINSASPKAVAEVTEGLRKALGSLPLTPLNSEDAPAAIMTEWLHKQQTPSDIVLSDECELRDSDSIVRCKGQDLLSDEIKVHLDAGKQVTRLALEWDERLGMILSDDLILRRLKMLDVLDKELDADAADDPVAAFDASFVVLSSELRRCLGRLLELLGGELRD